MTFMDLISEYWWLIFAIMIMPYSLYFLLRFLKMINTKNSQRKIVKNYSHSLMTEEEKYLGINITNDDPKVYKKRIEDLIFLLNKTKGKVQVNAVEAIMLVELFSDSVLVNENGELVIDLKTALNFSKAIYHDPMKFITYIKAVETKLDLNNKDNKIELGDVLYMMRNARKFGLYMENNDTDLVYKIKSAIHEADYKDVTINIVEDFNNTKDDDNKVEDSVPTKTILRNTYKADSKTKENEELIDDKNIASFEKLDDGKIRVTTKDGIIITKDDTMIYSLIQPEEDEVKSLEIKREEIEKLAHVEDTRLKDYISKFGKLDVYEEEHKDEFKFKDRCLRIYDEQITDYQSFKVEDFKYKNFFEDEKLYLYFLSKLFNKELAIINGLPHIFIGEINLTNKAPMRYLTIDANWFLCFVYSIIKREDRESFFKFIYTGKNINTNNVNIFLRNINREYDLFFPEDTNFLFDAIYTFRDTSLKSLIFKVKLETLKLILETNNHIDNKYLELKEYLDGAFRSKAYGENAKKQKADITFGHDTFFRVPINERSFKEKKVVIDDELTQLIDEKPF